MPTATPTSVAPPTPLVPPTPTTVPTPIPTPVPVAWQRTCLAGSDCPAGRGHVYWTDPATGDGMCSAACDCQLFAQPIPPPPEQTGPLPNPLPPGFDGFWRQVLAQVGVPTLKYRPYPSGLVGTDTEFTVPDESARFSPSESGSTLGVGDWGGPTGDAKVTWQNYRLSIRWKFDQGPGIVWDFADGSSPIVGGLGQAGTIRHQYERSSYGQPLTGPRDPKVAAEYTGQTPAYPVTGRTIWTAEYRVEYDEVRTVEDSFCVGEGDPSATDHSDDCAGEGANHHSGTRQIFTHVGPSGWQTMDMRLLGHPTSFFEQITELPIPILQLQSVIVR